MPKKNLPSKEILIWTFNICSYGENLKTQFYLGPMYSALSYLDQTQPYSYQIEFSLGSLFSSDPSGFIGLGAGGLP